MFILFLGQWLIQAAYEWGLCVGHFTHFHFPDPGLFILWLTLHPLGECVVGEGLAQHLGTWLEREPCWAASPHSPDLGNPLSRPNYLSEGELLAIDS